MKYYIAEDKEKDKIYIVNSNNVICRAYNLALYRNGKLQRNCLEGDYVNIDANVFDEYGTLNEAVEGLRSGCVLLPVGEFTAYKICRYLNTLVLVKLKVPKDSKRVKYVYGNKIRVEKAYVECINYLDKDIELKYHKCNIAISLFDVLNPLVYKVGEYVVADEFDSNAYIKCTNGIHCFLTKEEALIYITNNVL